MVVISSHILLVLYSKLLYLSHLRCDHRYIHSRDRTEEYILILSQALRQKGDGHYIESRLDRGG